MDISLEDLAKLSSEDIYQRYKVFFDNVFSSNFFNKISYPEYLSIVYDEIENSKIEYNGNSKYDIYIKRRIIQRAKSEETYVKTDLVGAYIKDIDSIVPYSKDEEDDLIRKAQNGDREARNRLIEGNLKLVISIAKRYIGRKMPFEDLIQEGNLGLVRAIQKYDFSKEAKLSTYSVWWIRQSITRGLANKASEVRIPVYLRDRLNKLRKTQTYLAHKLNRKSTNEELAREMGLSVEQIEQLIKLDTPSVSLNDPIGDEDDLELLDIIADDQISIEQKTEISSLKEDVDQLLEECKLTPREMDVLKLRCGFDDKEPITLEEIGKMYGVTRERIRQIENRALNKLRASKRIFNFVNYMDHPKEAFDNIKKIYDYLNKGTGLDNLPDTELIIHEDGTIEKRKLKTIFNSFPYYSRAKINDAISKLSLLDQFFLYFRYGGNLEKPYSFALTKGQIDYFNESILPKLSSSMNSISDDDNIIYREEFLQSNAFTKSDLIALRSCFKRYRRFKNVNSYSFNNFFINNLKNGYVNRKMFSDDDIMKILHLTETEYNICIQEDENIQMALKATKKMMKKL